MNFEEWLLVIGEEQTRTWGGNSYRFRIGKEQNEANPIFRELQSNTPLRKLVERASRDGNVRGLLFLSYYLINPTFRRLEDEVGTNFFTIPLDELTEEQYQKIAQHFDDDGDGVEEEEDDESDEPIIADFPLMSTVGEPVITAATSESYAKKLDKRTTPNDRRELLQEEIERQKEDQVNQIEEWLEEGFQDETFHSEFSTFTELTGLVPTYFLLTLIFNERDRLQNIRERIDSLDILSGENESAELLQILNSLSADVQALQNTVIEGFCLDNNNTGCEFHLTKHRGVELGEGLDTCESCNSPLFRVYRGGLEEKVKDAWMMGMLPELATAATFQRCDWVEEVIPQRMVQMETDDGITSSVEVDVTVHTKNDEVIFFEVTSQGDKALSRINRKREKFEKSGIEYDGIVQLSLADNMEFIPFGDKTIAGAGWMIPNLNMTEFYEDMTSMLGD